MHLGSPKNPMPIFMCVPTRRKLQPYHAPRSSSTLVAFDEKTDLAFHRHSGVVDFLLTGADWRSTALSAERHVNALRAPD
jgi:hypothetical protein